LLNACANWEEFHLALRWSVTRKSDISISLLDAAKAEVSEAQANLASLESGPKPAELAEIDNAWHAPTWTSSRRGRRAGALGALRLGVTPRPLRGFPDLVNTQPRACR
jgi:hypothetical protein